MPTLDSLFKKDAKTITSREPGWLKEAREVSGYADRVAEIEASVSEQRRLLQREEEAAQAAWQRSRWGLEQVRAEQQGERREVGPALGRGEHEEDDEGRQEAEEILRGDAEQRRHEQRVPRRADGVEEEVAHGRLAG